MEKPTFEESIDEINKLIASRRPKWTLSALAWLNYDDISQIIRIHIFKKWHLYNPKQSLGPWINRIISNQIKNLVRNNYGNYARPCLRCPAMEGEDICRIYVKQCGDCPLYAVWEKRKKRAYDTKLPVSLEHHEQEVFNRASDSFDMVKAADNIHAKMKTILKPMEWRVYDYLFVQQKTEEEVAKMMNLKTNEKGRKPGYKQIRNIRKNLIDKVKKVLYTGDVDIV